MVGAITSEPWAASDRNRWAAYVGIRKLEGARYVWVPPETRLRPVQLRPLLLGENVWKDGKWVYVPTHYAGQ